MTKVLKIFTLSMLSIFFLKYGIYASGLSIIDETEEYKLNPNPIKIVEKKDLNIANVQESSELCKGKAFKQWIKEKNQEWAKNHENYHDKLMVLAPFVLGEAVILNNINLSSSEVTVSLIGGWLMADFFTGATHCFFDNFSIKSKDYQSLSVLEEVALKFQGHHYFPNNVTESSYWSLTRTSYLLVLPVLASGCLLSCYDYGVGASLLSITALMTAQSQYVHALSHGKYSDHRLVKLLQETGLILSPKVHNEHHKDPEHASSYGVVNGHMNWVLDSFISVGRSSYKFFRNWSGAMPTKKMSY
jgi:hypothetical protein